jgi:hypothetical protein
MHWSITTVYGSLTNNKGFWIGWLDLLTASFTISLKHNQLRTNTQNIQLNSSSLTAEDSFHSCSRHNILQCYISSARCKIIFSKCNKRTREREDMQHESELLGSCTFSIIRYSKKYWMMENVQEPSNSGWDTPTSEPCRICMQHEVEKL